MSDQTDSLNGGEDKSAETHVDLSQAQTDETKTGNSLAGEALAKAAMNDPEARKILQSQKDKGVDQAVKTANAALAEVERLGKALGHTPEEIEKAQKEILIDDLYQKSMGNSQSDAGGQTEAEAQTEASSKQTLDITSAFADSGWDLSQVPRDQVDFAKQFEGNQTELKNALLDRRIDSENKSPSAIASTGGKSAAGMKKDKALRIQYDTDFEALVERYKGVVPPNAADKLKKDYRAKGLDIW